MEVVRNLWASTKIFWQIDSSSQRVMIFQERYVITYFCPVLDYIKSPNSYVVSVNKGIVGKNHASYRIT